MSEFNEAVKDLRHVVFIDGKAVAAFLISPDFKGENVPGDGSGYFIDAIRDDFPDAEIETRSYPVE